MSGAQPEDADAAWRFGGKMFIAWVFWFAELSIYLALIFPAVYRNWQYTVAAIVGVPLLLGLHKARLVRKVQANDN